jgi:hypothetical protein
MSRTIETIMLGESTRLRVEQDMDAVNPREDAHMMTGFFKIDGAGDSRMSDVTAVHEPPMNIDKAFSHFRYWMYDRAFVPFTDISYRRFDRAVLLTERWARIFHGLALEWDHEHGGFWFVAGADAATSATEVDAASRALFHDNWPDLQHGTDEHLSQQIKVIGQEQETYRQWAEGEVYGVILERKQRYVAVIDSGSENIADEVDWGSEIEQWEEVDGGDLWGCYLDEDYTAITVATEYFDLTDAERAAAAGYLTPAA